MNRPEAERAVVELLNGVYKIVIIAVHPDPYTVYPKLELDNGNLAEFIKTSRLNVCYYKEVENGSYKGSSLFRRL